MQFTTVALSLFAAAATAQSTNSTSDSLPDLVAQLPTCAIGCFDSAASGAGCSTTDFECLCSTQQFITNVGICVLVGSSTCESDDIATASDLANRICADVKDNPDPSEVAEASNLVTSALASATASSTATATATDEPDAAARPRIAFGMVGIGLLAALAM